eukprot:m.67173 g.67173  ORF g.67173 m.67173 type:complete len:328 (+) comp11571_c2_seq1:66-1049(+)
MYSTVSMRRETSTLSYWKHVSFAAPFFALFLLIIAYYGIHSEDTRKWDVTESNYKLYTFPKVDPEIVPTKNFLIWIFAMVFLVPVIDYYCVRHCNRKLRIICGLNVGFGLLEAFLYTVALTEFGKKWVTEPRPDFVDRCTGSPTDIPTFDANGIIICTQQITEDAMLSFPSGHSSTSFVTGVFLTAYFIWLAYFRKVRTPWRSKCGEWKGSAGALLGDFSYMLAMWPLVVAMYIAASRIVDHRHSPADVVAGSFLGTMVGLVVFPRVMARVSWLENTYPHECEGSSPTQCCRNGSKQHRRKNTDTGESGDVEMLNDEANDNINSAII